MLYDKDFRVVVMLRIFAILLMISGCASIKAPDDYAYKEVKSGDFTLATWQKVSASDQIYKIYIEGDGYAFNEKGKASIDPTPRSTLVRDLAFNDKSPNVIYIARPCQFIKTEACHKKYWTTARFSEEVIDSTAEAIKDIAGNNDIVLVGYSGGAQVAGLVAVTNHKIKVKKIITIAGNLDHEAWTTYHNLPPLSESMNLRRYKSFDEIAQIHYVGEKDEVIPTALMKRPISDRIKIIIVPNVTHYDGWESLLSNI